MDGGHTMKRYIEVVGEGEFIETAARFLADVTLEVRASKDETALRELAELWDEALAALRNSGIRDEEIVEGGTDVRRPWYWKKKVGQNVTRKILLKVPDFSRLNDALESLEPLQSRHMERKTISVEMRQPEFENSNDSRSSALAQAFEDAKSKAVRLATAMNCTLGDPIHVEEGGWSKRNSGFSGDEDWWGDSGRFAAAAGVLMEAGGSAPRSPEPAVELQRPSRTIFVKCRVRFGVAPS